MSSRTTRDRETSLHLKERVGSTKTSRAVDPPDATHDEPQLIRRVRVSGRSTPYSRFRRRLSQAMTPELQVILLVFAVCVVYTILARQR
jgi:hypothetical protein